jgi:hypothetical protein
MTISRLGLKVSEVALALGMGSSEDDMVAELWMDGYPRSVIDRIMHDARELHLATMLEQQKIEQEQSTRQVQQLIQELVLMEQHR